MLYSLRRANKSPRNFPSFCSAEVAVGRAHDAHVDALGQRRADGDDLLRLKNAQELRLRLEGHVADLVEQERAAVGRANEAHLVAVGARERAALVAEELALEERRRDGRAVDGLERAAAAAPLVELLREYLLARAALAEEHDADLALRHAPERAREPVDLVAADDGALRADVLRIVERRAEDDAVDAVAREALGAGLHELEDGVADADLVALLERDLGDELAVDQGAVAAAEVLQHPPAVHVVDARVLPRDGGLGDADAARRVAADDEIALVQQVRGRELLVRRREQQHEPRARALPAVGRGREAVHLHRRGGGADRGAGERERRRLGAILGRHGTQFSESCRRAALHRS